MAKSLREIEEQMASVGIYLPPNVELFANRENWQRFKPLQSRFKRGKDAWFGIWEHTLSSGAVYFFGVFGVGSESYKIEHKKSGWSAAEWTELQKRRDLDQKIIDEAVEKKRAAAAQKAQSMFQAAQPSVSANHPYVQKKSIRPVGARQLGASILIPLNQFRGNEAVLVGLQTIAEAENEDGSKSISKKFLYGSATKSSWALLGRINENTKVVYVCEGWATGCSIYEAVQCPVVVAFSAGNLLPVLSEFKSRYPEATFVIAADNDSHYLTRLRSEIKRRYDWELEVYATKSSMRPQYIDVPGGQVEIHAYWSKKDGMTCIQYAEKTPGQNAFSRRTLFNTGIDKAHAAAARCGGKVVCPQFSNAQSEGTDFNDLALEEGIDVVRSQLDLQKAVSFEEPANLESKDFDDDKKGRVISELSERFVHVYPEDCCWDLKEKLLVKIGVLKACYDSKIVTAYLNNSFGNLKRVRKDQLVFRPDNKVPEGCINIFTGWKVQPKKGDCHLLIEHLFKICGEDERVFDWVLKWLAYPIQHPGAKMHTALVVFGEREGTGKGMFFDTVARIYGRDYSRHIDQQLMNSRFNAWLSQKLFIVADEVVTSKDRRELKGKLKNLITSPVHQLEEKNQPVREEENFTNFVFLSNELQPIALDWFNRRYMCIEYNANLPPEYFTALSHEIENGGVEALCQYLLDVDLGDFSPSTRLIETEASKNLRTLGTDSARRFIMTWLDGETPFPVSPACALDLYRAYQLWLPSAGERSVMSSTGFLIRAGSILSKLEKIRVQVYESEFNPEVIGAEKTYADRRVTVYFPEREQADLSVNPPTKDVLSPQLRQFQESVYAANRRFRNYGHI